jgi:hypothetical protein
MSTNHRLCNYVFVLTVCLLLSSCAIYKPKPYIPPSVLKNQYLADVTSPTLLKDYNDLTKWPQGTDAERQAKVARRNQILQELIALINQNYSIFEDKYYGSDASVSFGGDVANLGLTGVASVTGTAHLKSILSAIATGTTGIKTSYEKNFFDQQTRAAVVQKMRAGRASQLALIQDQNHMKAPVICDPDPDKGCPMVTVTGADGKPAQAAVAPYSLETGLSDVEQYYQAGTIIGALQAIATSAGVDQSNATTKQNTNSTTQQLF